MKFREIMVICLILCCILSLQTVVAGDNIDTNDTLSSADDSVVEASDDSSLNEVSDEETLGAGGGSFTDLANLIGSNSYVELNQNYTYNDAIDGAYKRGIFFQQGITIDGHGYTLDGNNLARILSIGTDQRGQHLGTNGPVILKNIQFINAYSNEGDQNTAFGAIEITGINPGTTFLVENCTFLNNKAPCAGAMAIGYFDARDVTITNCTFDGNTATGQGGGAIRLWNNVNNFKVKNTIFKNNYAATYSGAVQMSSSGEGTLFDNCTFISNHGDSGAGAILSTFGFTINNCTFTDNYGGSGGAIYSNGGSVLINRTKFNNNRATANSDNAGGGVLYKTSGENDLIFDNCEFIGNSAVRSGGVIYTLGSNTVINNSYAHDNKAKYANNYNSNNLGGVVFANGVNNNFIAFNSTFDLCSAYKGGAFHFNNFNSNTKSVLVDGCNFTNNEVTYSGGSIRIEDTVLTVHIYNSEFINGSAIREGGAISENKNVNYFILANLTCINCSQKNTGNQEGGGAIDIVTVKKLCQLDNIRFINCSSDKRGGAILLHGAQNSDLAPHNLTNLYFENCTSLMNGGGQGGAIANVNTNTYSPAVTFENITIVDCSALYQGGAIYWAAHREATFNNVSISNTHAGTLGGAIYWKSDVASTISNVNIANATADSNGGAIYVDSASLTITDVNITNSSAVNGGAIYYNANNGIVSYCNLIGNNASANGGAIYFASQNGRILSSNFTDNRATGNGGAVYVGKVTDVTIQDTTFKDSYAYNGGAVYYEGAAGASLYINNDTFIKNIASHNGGAVYYVVDNEGQRTRVIYRDYLNFTKDGIVSVGVIDPTTGRTTVTMESNAGATFSDRILDSYFEDNMDYILDVSAEPMSRTIGGIVNVSNPRDPNKNKYRVVMNVTNGGTLVTQLILNTTADYETYYNEVYKKFIVNIRNNLAKNTEYNVTVGFEDSEYLYKQKIVNFTTINVENRGDFHILQALIDDAIENHSGVLNLTRSYEFTSHEDYPNIEIPDDWCMNITSPLTINGNGFSINALEYSRIFNITAENVVLNNIQFINGNSNGQYADGVDKGGAIFWSGENGVLNNCTFRNNIAEYGGGLYLNESALNNKIRGCLFDENDATKNGGAIDCNAPGMNLTYTSFVENHASEYGAALCREQTATGGFGQYNNFTSNHAEIAGAALAWMNASSININHYIFIDNTAGYSGGAIYVGNGSGKCVVNNSYFEGNNVTGLTDGHGGAIEWYANNGTIINSTFINNNAYEGGAVFVGNESTEINITDSNFTKNNALQNGGAINVEGSHVTLNNTNFFDNTADVNGGALYIGGDGITNRIYSSSFDGNNATGRGGAIDWSASAGHIEKSNFTNNFADYGGAIYLHGISSNTNITGVIFKYNNATHNGGAIDCNATGMNLSYTSFDFNYAGEYGAALCRESNATSGHGKYNNFTSNHAGIAGAALAWMNVSNINIDHYIFIDNTADASGGAIYASVGSNNFTINNCDFKGNNVTNTTGGHGGAIDAASDNNTIKNSNFTNNNAFYGGAIFVGSASGNTNITNVTFTKNNADVDGGAINLQSSGVKLNDTRFYENTAVRNGGGLYVGGEGTTNVIYDSEFKENEAGNNGGAIYWRAYAGHIEYTNFTSNKAINGGGIYLNGVSSNTNITHVIFKLNNATKNGGAIDCNATRMNLTYTSFDSNYAGEYGAALCREVGATSGFGHHNNFTSNHAGIAGAALAWMNVSNINIDYYIFKDNTADAMGGAIYASQGSDNFTINHCDFKGNNITNSSDGYGGAIYSDSSNNTIKNSNFTNNNAFYGGGIYVGGDSGHTNITNVTFDRNNANVDGGAINLIASGVRLNGTHFYNNTAQRNGGAVYVGGTGTTNVVYDSEFVENKANGHGGAIDWRASAGDIMNTNFLKNSAEYGGAIYLNGVSSGSKISHVYFGQNTATKNGGAIDCNATLMNLTHTKFVSNRADEYGAALCREAGATGGFGVNNTFDKNHAGISGAALAWLDVNNIKINNYTFTNNTADYSGGAIYVSYGSDNCKVYNSTFEDNYISNAIDGRGGAIDWVGDNGGIENTTFTRCISVNAGGVYVGARSHNMYVQNVSFTSCESLTNGGAIVIDGNNVTIANSNFTSSVARDNGGAIAGLSSDNGNITGCIFMYNVVGGHIDPQGNIYGEGGAIYWENSKNLTMYNNTFETNAARLSGGSISANNVSDSLIDIMRTHDETAFTDGGSIAWINSNNVTIKNGFFNDSGSNYKGGTLYFENINATVKDTVINSTWASWGKGGAIYVAGNLTMDNISFNDTHSDEDNATAIYFESGISSLSNSNFTYSYNSIGIQKGANVTLTKNNLTAADPNKLTTQYIKENTTYAASLVRYSVWNEGDLYLEKNNFDYVIFNNGTIWTHTTTKMLNNGTYEVEWNETFVFFANITDDNNNTIISVKTLKATNDVYQDVGNFYLLPFNADEIRCIYQGVFHLLPVDEGLKDNTPYNGTLKVKMPVFVELEFNNLTKETIEIIAHLTPKYKSNYTINNTQTLIFKINNGDTYTGIVFDNNQTEGAFQTWNIANSTWIRNNLAAGTYTVTANYTGDDYHIGYLKESPLIIELRSVWIKVHADSIAYGNTAVMAITSNATSGMVVVSVNGKYRGIVYLENGEAEYTIPNDLYADLLDPDEYLVSVVYTGNANYSFVMNETTFHVYKLNTTVNATPIASIEVGENEEITVIVNDTYVPKNATGFVKITIGTEEYYKKLNETGGVKFTIPGLTKNMYRNINVTYEGDRYFNGSSSLISFDVGQSDDYNITVHVDNITYGQNATIYISLPISVSQNLTVFVNKTEFKNVTIENGMAIVTVPDLAVGTYTVNVTYPGDDVYAPKDKNGTKFKVTKSDFYAINVTAIDVKVDENTTITVHVPKDATGSVTIWVNGTSKVNSTIVDGVVTFTLNKTQAGKYDVNATLSDDNYANITAYADYYVSKYETPIDIAVNPVKVGDQVEITVTVPKDVSNNVTIEVAGKLYNKSVDADGKAVFTVPSLENTTRTVVVTYDGDRKYMFNSTTANFTVNKRDSRLNVTAVGNSVGDNATITVQVQSNATGFVNVDINGTVYSIALNSTGGGKLNVTGLGNGTYYVHATYLGDDQYKPSTNNTETFEMVKVVPDVAIDVQNVTYGNHTVIVVTVPGATGNIAIIINETDKGQFTLVNGKVEFDAGVLAVENYTVYVSYLGDYKYATGNAQKDFNVSKATPTIVISDITVDSLTNASVIVTINTDASGKMNITVNKKNYTADIEDGIATFTVDKLPVGEYDIVATYAGDDNYTKGSTTLADGLTVTKGSSYKINVTAVDVVVGQNTTITVHVPKDATGNVTIWVNGTKKVNATIVDGISTFTLNQTKAGRYVVNATLSDDKYANKTAYTSYLVSKVETPITITIADKDNIKVGDTVEITVDLPDEIVGEKVTIEINGKSYDNVTGENGIATFTVPSITYGNKTVTAIYLGNNKYVNNATTANFTVNKRDSRLNVTAVGNSVGNNATITVQVQSNATGIVNVDVNGTVYSIALNSTGGGKLNVTGLGNGTYYVHATYVGDDQYKPSTNNTETFVMIKSDVELAIEVESIDYGQKANITVTVSEDDATGFITIRINETAEITLPVGNGKVNWIVDGLAADNYTVYANYSGDGKYNANNTDKVNESFEVRQISPEIRIISVLSQAGDEATIVVQIDPRATGNIKVNVDKDYIKEIGTGVIVITTDKLANGTYTVNASYVGDKNFTKDEATFTFTTNKTSDYAFNVTAEDIKVGELTDITVNVPSDAKGIVIVEIEGQNYTATINDGKAVFNNQTGLPAGKYDIIAYFGNEEYANRTATGVFYINKYDAPISIEVEDIKVGDVAYINVTAPSGDVTIEINGKSYDKVKYENGVAYFEVPALAYGDKTVVAVYGGTDTYVANTTTENFTVSKHESKVDVTAVGNSVGGNATITVQVQEDATGYVNVDINGTVYSIALNSTGGGKLEVALGNGTYYVHATYAGDDQYLTSTNNTETFEMNKNPSEIKVSVENITFGDVAIVNITVLDDATGTITVKVNNTEVTVGIVKGKAIAVIPNLKVGNYTVDVTYNGDGKYETNTSHTTFEVSKVNMTESDITVVDQGNGTVVVVVPGNATGNVTIKVGNDTYNATVINGTAVITLENVTPGEHNITVIYSGDGNYTNVTTNATVTIPRYETPIKVTPENIYVGDTANIRVELPVNATGKITIEINGKVYEPVSFENSVAEFAVADLAYGNKTVAVKYYGDGNYSSNSTTSNFTVSKRVSSVNVTAAPTTVGSDLEINVTIPSNATGYVIVTINGIDFAVNTTGGNGTLIIKGFEKGDYPINVVYLGDEQYLANVNSTDVSISKLPSSLNVTVEDIGSGVAVITVEVLDDATGNVTVKVNETVVTVGIVDGKAVAVIPNMEVGNYTVNVTYNGDRKYETSSNTTALEIKKVKLDTDMVVIDQGNGTVVVVIGDNATGNVTIKVGDNEYNATVINGTAVVNIGNETPGIHEVEVIYSGDDDHNATNSTVNITMPKYDSEMNITVGEAKEGEPVIITVEVPQNATGNVTVYIDGKEYPGTIENGQAVVTIDPLTAGNKTVTVEYSGDDNYTANYTIDTFTVEPAKIVSDITVVDLGNGTVVVVVGDNATGNVTIKIGDNKYNATVVNGTAVVEIGNETPGIHEAEVIYSGDDTHTNATEKVNITAPKYDTEMNVTVGEAKEGEPVIITVEVPDDATGDVIVHVGGKNYTATIDGGKAIVPVDNISPGNHTIAVEYLGDDNYKANYSISNVSVEPAKVIPDVKVIDQGNGTVVVVVGDNATGNVTIKVGDDTYNATVINGTAVVTLENVTPGTHEIEVIYSGDDTHNATNTTAEIVAPKYDTVVEVDVTSDNQTATITVKVPENATGNVTVTIDGHEYPGTIENGQAVVTVDNLTPGDKTVIVEYSGDDNYAANYTIANFTIDAPKVDPDVKVIDQGNGTIVVVVGDNATGNVTVTVDGQNYTAEVVNGTAVVTLENVTPGTHDVEVIYSGDGTHNNATANATIEVSKRTTQISIEVDDIKVGDKAVIKVTVADDAKGNVTIEIDGRKYTEKVVNGVATFEVEGLTAGNKSVFAVYNGDEKYEENYISDQFDVGKVDSKLTVLIDDIHVGENVTITVNVPEDATGQVLIDIDGVGYYVNVTDGKGIIEIPRMPNGEYNVTLTYTGDDKYLPSTNTSTFKVSKLESFVIPIAENIYVGDNENIRLLVPADATGNVTLVIDGDEYNFNLNEGSLGVVYVEGDKYTVAISGGNGELVISGLPKGEYTVSVRYNGDEKYLPATNTTIFTVSKQNTPMDVVDQGNGTIVVTLPEDATGTVTVKVDNETYTAEVVDGKAVITLENTTPGKHDVEVKYSGDNNYASNSTDTTVDIPKYDTPITVEAHDINVGDTEVVAVTVPEGATGTVTIEINGVEYTEKVSNGKAIFHVKGLAFGEKTVAVKYSGDDSYNDNYTTGQFTVSKVPSTISATGKDIKVGKDEVITVTVPADATGRVLVDIDGVGYYGTIINGKAKVIIPELYAGKYTAKVTYDGDDKYLPSKTTVKFTVSKSPAPISASSEDIRQGEDATVIVHVPTDATGTVTITVDGKKYTTEVENGKAIFVIPGLTKGDHGVTATYSGDKRYEANDTITDIEVLYNESTIDKNEPVSEGGISLAKYPTGNPILLVLFAVITASMVGVRRFK